MLISHRNIALTYEKQKTKTDNSRKNCVKKGSRPYCRLQNFQRLLISCMGANERGAQ